MTEQNLYLVQHECRPAYVVAPSWQAALDTWRQTIIDSSEVDDWPDGESPEPDGIQLVAWADELILPAGEPAFPPSDVDLTELEEKIKRLDESRKQAQQMRERLAEARAAGDRAAVESLTREYLQRLRPATPPPANVQLAKASREWREETARETHREMVRLAGLPPESSGIATWLDQQLSRLGKIPAVRARAGVGDGTLVAAVEALVDDLEHADAALNETGPTQLAEAAAKALKEAAEDLWMPYHDPPKKLLARAARIRREAGL